MRSATALVENGLGGSESITTVVPASDAPEIPRYSASPDRYEPETVRATAPAVWSTVGEPPAAQAVPQNRSQTCGVRRMSPPLSWNWPPPTNVSSEPAPGACRAVTRPEPSARRGAESRRCWRAALATAREIPGLSLPPPVGETIDRAPSVCQRSRILRLSSSRRTAHL